MRWILLIAIVLGVTIIGIALDSALCVPPGALTITRFTLIRVRMGYYYQANHKLPSRLEELPERPGMTTGS